MTTMQLNNSNLMTAQQVATMTGMSERWIRKMTASGDLGCYRLGRKVRYDEEQVQAWLMTKRSYTKADNKFFAAKKVALG